MSDETPTASVPGSNRKRSIFPRWRFVRIPIGYVILGSLWIILSDEIVLEIAHDPVRNRMLQTFKGLAYVFGTGILLFLALRLYTQRLARSATVLRDAAERYRIVAETANDALITIDEDGTILFVNPASERVFGYEPGELLGKSLDVVVPPHLRTLHKASFHRYLASGVRHIPWEGVQLPGLHKSGREIPMEVSFAEYVQEGRRRFTGICRDVSERKRSEEALREREGQLRQAQKMEAIGRLSGGVAHDFNNLLTVIGGYADLLLKRMQPSDPAWNSVQEIRKAGDRASALTRQLLAFSRAQVLSPKVFGMNEAVGEMDGLLRRLIGEDIEMVIELDPGVGSVLADPGQVEQVLMNLVLNARDSMTAGGRLWIRTKRIDVRESGDRYEGELAPGAYVCLEVEDTGVGMDAEVLSHVFEPFFTTKEKGKGTGLGLSTVYGIVRQSGGNVFVTSQRGKGSVFQVYLPRVQEGTPAGAAPVSAKPVVRGTETILVVEDDEAVRGLVHDTLSAHGYTVLVARDGLEAVEVAKANPQRPIHLLVTDLVMPRLGGKEAAARLLEIHPELRVLYISGYTDRAIVQQGVLEPGMELLAKPFTMETLLWKAKLLLGRVEAGGAAGEGTSASSPSRSRSRSG
jgi:PAS domain S-box-containing protein